MACNKLWKITFVCLLGSIFFLPSAEAWVSKRSRLQLAYKIPFKPKWTYGLKTKGLVSYRRLEFSSPVADEDTVYVGADSGYFYAIRLDKGRKRWRFDSGDPINSKAALSDRAVFFGNDNGDFFALDKKTGVLLWKKSFKAPIVSAPRLVNGIVYVVNLRGFVVALDAASGEQKWFHLHRMRVTEMTAYGQSQVIDDADNGFLYVGFADGKLLALNPESGTEIWSKDLSGGGERLKDLDAPVTLDGPYLFAANFSGNVYCLDKNTGLIIWKNPISSAAQILVAGEQLFVSGADGVLYALSKRTGQEIWHSQLNAGSLSRPVLFHDLLAVSSTEQSMIFVDALSGYKIMQRFAKKHISSAPILAGPDQDILVYSSNGARVYALHLRKDFRYGDKKKYKKLRNH
jgi:outer membrane protein assembly factor BamB